MFNDYAEVDMGHSCPMNYPGAEEGDGTSTFMASFVYDLPTQDSIVATSEDYKYVFSIIRVRCEKK